jgi:SnoaL-like domain
MSEVSEPRDCPEYCFQGSTVFYDTPETDEYTPSYLEAGLLEFNIATRHDGTHPSWIRPHSTKSPIEQYVEWFNGIWHTGDPSLWNASVFTNTATMIDPTGTWRGADASAATFQVLFKYFPELRGEVVSWAANDREIIINWRFMVKQRGSETPLLVPVIDKFCFRDGCVSYRLAFFDILTFVGYMTNYYGQGQVTDYLKELIGRAEKGGGVESIPTLIWRVIKGLFVWPTPTPSLKIQVTPRDGFVALTWEADPDAKSYAVTRATDLAGPFETPQGAGDASQVKTNSYVDTDVNNGVTYWYLVSPNKWKPVSIVPGGHNAHRSHNRRRHPQQEDNGASRGKQAEAAPAEETPHGRSVRGNVHETEPTSNN